MKYSDKIIVTIFLILGGSVLLAATPEKGEQIPMAKFCAGCHKPEPGVMMGFLDNISIKAKTIQMSFISHKDTVKFTDETKIKNLKSFEDIRRYKNKGFRINFKEKNGDKYATEIIRFDIVKTVAAEEKLTKEAFKNQLHNENVAIYDVRPPMMYKAAHIPGSKPLPAPAFDKFAKTLPENKDTPLILYGPGGCLSPTTSIRAKSLGYTNVKIYTRGFADWSKTEYSVTTPDWLKMAIDKEVPFVLIDVRPEETARQGHIKGAVSIPLDRIDESKDSFPEKKNAPIVIYGEDKQNIRRRLFRCFGELLNGNGPGLRFGFIGNACADWPCLYRIAGFFPLCKADRQNSNRSITPGYNFLGGVLLAFPIDHDGRIFLFWE